MSEVTALLQRWADGDHAAAAAVMPLVYDELRRIAAAYARGERGETLGATALVHEAYLRLYGQAPAHWESRGHFLGIAARVMRQVLVDYGRERFAAKRGGGVLPRPLDDARAVPGGGPAIDPAELLALDEALHRLAEHDPREAAVVELRFFGGLTVAESAEALGVSEKTVIRSWRRARAWLFAELEQEGTVDRAPP